MATRALFIAIVATFLASSCTIFEQSRPQLPTEDGGQTEDTSQNVDVAPDKRINTTIDPDASDASKDFDQEMPIDMRPPPCLCVDPAATCTLEGKCIIPDACNLVTLCPENFDCVDTTCVCADDAVCGQACQKSIDCLDVVNRGSVCVDGACRVLGDQCLNDDDALCPAETVCRLVLNSGEIVCAQPGPVMSEGACDDNRDCDSLLCATRVCLQTCRRNDECPPNQFCGIPVGQQTPACTVIANACTNAQFGRPNDVCSTACSISQDCAGNCEYNAALGFSTCSGFGQLGCPTLQGEIRRYQLVGDQCVDPTRWCASNEDCDDSERCNAPPNAIGHCRR